MKKAICAAATALVAASGTATAADFPGGGAPYYSPAPRYYNWAGPYAGVNLGYQWGDVTNNPTSPSGFEGGLQAGYNWQRGQFVFGAEADMQASGADDTFAPYKFSNPWFGTLRGRAGLAYNNVLFYGTLGLALGELKGQNLSLEETKTLGGWAGGLGVEVGFNQNWSARIEYLYMDLSSRAYSITGVDNGLRSNMIRFGINYHF
ncbi:MAG TPA: outer membrane protein [Pseudolabrys sp.]|nr:outer membrane protein [Pseudolabrys sp.]